MELNGGYAHKEMKNRYKQLLGTVKEVVDQWDPIGLLEFCPPDEYDMEINAIAAITYGAVDEEKLAAGIMVIFTEYFGSDTFENDIDDCRRIARILINKLNTV